MTEPDDPNLTASDLIRSAGGSHGDDAWVQDALRVDSPMPAIVWERLSSALLAEQALRQAQLPGDGGATITLLAGRRRRPRLLIGVAAAAAVLILAGLVGSFAQDSGGDSGVIVAADAPKSAPPLLGSARQDTAALDDVPDAPAKQVVASGIDYGPDTMTGDVQKVVDTIGASTARLMADVRPDTSLTEGSTGFTSTLPALRSCLTWLTGSSEIQALFVDRSTYQGTPAAIVVVPDSIGGSLLASMDVWIVSLDCVQEQSSILMHDQVSLTAD